MNKLLLAIFFLSFCSSCSSVEDQLCREDKFFCGDIWESNLNQLSDAQFIDALDTYYKVMGSGNTIILDNISKREGLISYIYSMDNDGIYIRYAHPLDIILSLSEAQKKEICLPNNRKELSKSFSSKIDAKLAIDIFCSGKKKLPN